MTKYWLLLLLPLTVLGSRSPAAVFEDVFELGRPNVAFLATSESRNGMKAYLRKKYRQMRDPLPQASMMAAYTAAHERYQNLEEKQYDRIRVENLRKLTSVRTKRLDGKQASTKTPKKIDIVPREMIRFELSDAMIFSPDLESQSPHQSKPRTKREEQPLVRIEPVPRELLRFELADAILSGEKSEMVNGSSKVARRHRRSASPDPRDYVKFELEDAKRSETSSYTAKSAKTTENLRHPFTSSDSYRRGKVFDEVVDRPVSNGRTGEASKKEKRENAKQVEDDEGSDMSPEESRRIKIRGKKQKQIANYEDLPLGVQKAIDIALKENERMNGKGRDGSLDGSVVQSTPKYFFGDKKPKTKKPYSSTTKISEPKFVPSVKLSETQIPVVENESNGQTGFIPSRTIGMDAVASPEPADSSKSVSSSVQGIPKAWWSYSDLRRPKRLYHKVSVQPLVISPQYVNTFKPVSEQSKMNELSPGYHPRSVFFSPAVSSNSVAGSQSAEHDGYTTSHAESPEEVVIKERPKIQYVIKEIPVPVQMKQPRTKITVQPSISISYDKDTTSPGTSESVGQGYDNPYGPIELQYGHSKTIKEPAQSFQSMKIVIPDSKEESREQENYYDSKKYNHLTDPTQPSTKQSNEIDTSGGSIAALSALIGQRPSVQLQGLNQLLHMPVPIGSTEKQHRPQDSKAPVTFPESSTPTPKQSRAGYRSVQIDHGPKLSTEVYDDSIYHTVQMTPQLQIPSHKEYTPIKEDVSDVLNPDLVGPTIGTPRHTTHDVSSRNPIPAQIIEHHEFNEEEAGHETNTYRHINIHSTPATQHSESILHHYQEQHHHHHHHSNEHYDDSEGYAFGYRVRDFHTGNDFGHVQNHDNGVTRGEYHILLPDGRVQNVRYTADEKGFHADVTYESVH
ncbi:uncharacterized protein LOC128708539 [Anopheles marshallii]|uniref:uncharacterized protein LOC128708539 n=1 Tax=Anopheles marshallii TaxID=1521116 RepID=UPI00237A3F30|nr:uncharacterized protein LOC128708539 [Anopheles marshallii]